MVAVAQSMVALLRLMAALSQWMEEPFLLMLLFSLVADNKDYQMMVFIFLLLAQLVHIKKKGTTLHL